MRIQVRDIPYEGLICTEDILPENLDLQEDEIIHLLSPLHIQAKVERVKQTVFVHAEVEGKYAFTCDRCLKPYDKVQNNSIELAFEIQPTTEWIELNEEIRQEIILVYPVKTICREDCLGLCPVCGTNLNLGKCTCPQ